MSTIAWIYAFTATVGVGWVAVSALMSGVFGADADSGGHADVGGPDAGGHGGADGHDHGGHSQTGFPFFSPYVVATFLAGFGLAGYAALAGGLPIFVHLPLSTAVGAGAGGSVGWLLFKLMNTWSASSAATVGRFAGTEGTVTLSLPEGGVGEVAFLIGGHRRTAPARHEGGEALPQGCQIVIERVDGATVFVKEDPARRIKRLADAKRTVG